jgi:phosphoribosylamine--glycine ligase
MNILVIGAGGREHALAYAIAKSPKCENLYVAPGNGGTDSLATNLSVSVSDFEAISAKIEELSIDLLVVGPEEPLVRGITDFLKPKHPSLKIIGPDAAGAQLEGSKDFAKQFMNKYGVPTASAQVFTSETLSEGHSFLDQIEGPYVLKADGLAAGKGVIITEDVEEAKSTLTDLLEGQKFGDASKSVLIEEFLSGIELSVFVLTDGTSYKILPEAKDYKRIGENDTGPNTGGMGAVSPVIFADRDFMQKVEDRVVKPTIEGIKEEGFDYKGFVFIGLMNQGGDPYVIEYNVRMGDPETEVVMPRISSDFLDLLVQTADGTLDRAEFSVSENTATTVMLVSEGYPGSYEKGRIINIGTIAEDTIVFHAGTKKEDDLLTNGGRVIAVTGIGDNLSAALQNSYSGVEQITWEGQFYRKDIGQDLKKRGQ